MCRITGFNTARMLVSVKGVFAKEMGCVGRLLIVDVYKWQESCWWLVGFVGALQKISLSTQNILAF